jgi:hypothetical protein
LSKAGSISLAEGRDARVVRLDLVVEVRCAREPLLVAMHIYGEHLPIVNANRISIQRCLLFCPSFTPRRSMAARFAAGFLLGVALGAASGFHHQSSRQESTDPSSARGKP